MEYMFAQAKEILDRVIKEKECDKNDPFYSTNLSYAQGVKLGKKIIEVLEDFYKKEKEKNVKI